MKQQKAKFVSKKNSISSVKTKHGAQQLKQSETLKKIGDFIDKHGTLFFLFFVLLLLGYIFYDFILLKYVYMFKGIGSDTVNIFYPNYYEITEYLKTEGLPKWSFSQGMGQNIFPFSFTPFNTLLYGFGILFGSENIPYFIIYKEILKILLGGLLFYWFLRTIPLKNYTAMIGGMLFTFSGFIILGSSWYVFSSEGYQLALLLLAFERLYKNNSWWLFPITVGLIGSFEPFNVYLYGLLLLAYMLLRILSEHGFQKKMIFSLLAKMFGLSVIGLCIAAALFLPNVKQMLDSPRVSGGASYMSFLLEFPFVLPRERLGNCVLRFFSNDIMGSGNDFKGFRNYLEAPMVYCGLFCLVAFTQIFTILSGRARIVYGVFFLLMVFTIVFPYLRYTAWLFAGDYYRGFSFFYSLLLMFFTLKTINHIFKVPKINIPVLLGTIFFLFLLLYTNFFPNKQDVIDIKIRSFVSIMLLVYGVFLVMLKNTQRADIFKVVLFALIFFELGFMNHITVNARNAITSEELTQKVGYNDYTVDAMNYLRSIDSGFYRIHKNYSSGPSESPSLNDAKVQNYFSTSSYNSYNQKYYIRFLENTDHIEKGLEVQSRWCKGLSGNLILRPWVSSKYYLAKEPVDPRIKAGYIHLKTIGDVMIYKTPVPIPFGFTYDSYMPLADFLKLSQVQKSVQLYRSFVCEDKDVQQFEIFKKAVTSEVHQGDYTNEILKSDAALLKKDTLQINHFSNNIITGTIHLDSTKLLFFTIPYSKGWTATVDGKEVKPMLINIGFMGFVLSPGTHAITLEFTPPLLKIGVIITCIGLFIYILLFGFLLHRNRRNV